MLVVGGGAAGLMAAIEAASRGASVAVACKGKAGRSGNSVIAASQFAAVIPYEGSEDSPERHFQDSLAGGKELNDERLLRLFVERAGPELLRAEERGVRLLRSGGELVRRTPPGHSRPRGIPIDNQQYPAATAGLSIVQPLRAFAERLGVTFLEGCPVLKLHRADGTVCGALAVSPGARAFLDIQAKAVVVAAGGAGRVFSQTNNTRDVSGGSYGLMLEAGAALRDMEFVQYYPSELTKPYQLLIISSLFGDGAVLRNRHGERFMPLYDPVNEDRATRDVMGQAMFREIQKGNSVDGDLYMDCTAVPEAALQGRYFGLVRDLRKSGVDPAKEWLRVSPTTHFIMGGALVDERCATTVPGLFAAGEAMGGLHGANRLGGNALSETLVTGAIGGASAAEYAKGRGLLPHGSESGLAEGEGGESLEAVRRELRRAMWEGASIVRSDASLQRALGSVRECQGEVERCKASTPEETARREETRLMCLAAEAMVRSALARRESRGAHFREDYPAVSDEWRGSNTVSLLNGELKVEFVPKK